MTLHCISTENGFFLIHNEQAFYRTEEPYALALGKDLRSVKKRGIILKNVLPLESRITRHSVQNLTERAIRRKRFLNAGFRLTPPRTWTEENHQRLNSILAQTKNEEMLDLLLVLLLNELPIRFAINPNATRTLGVKLVELAGRLNHPFTPITSAMKIIRQKVPQWPDLNAITGEPHDTLKANPIK